MMPSDHLEPSADWEDADASCRHLTPAMLSKVRAQAENICERIEHNPQAFRRSGLHVRDVVTGLLGDDADEASTVQVQEALWNLFDTILKRIVLLEESDDPEKENIIAAYYTQFFLSEGNYPSSVFEACAAPYKIIFASLFSAQPIVSGRWKKEMLEVAFFDLGQANYHQTAITLHDVLKEQDSVAVIDAVDFLRSLAAYAVKEESIHEDVVFMIQSVLGLLEDHPAALVRYAVTDAEWYIQQSYGDVEEEFSLTDRIVESDQPIFDSVRREHERLSRMVNVPEADGYHYFLSQIADDAIGLIDQHGLLQKICIDLDKTIFTERSQFPFGEVRRAVQHLTDEDGSPLPCIGTAVQCEQDPSAPLLRFALTDAGIDFADQDWQRFVTYVHSEGKIRDQFDALVAKRYKDLAQRNQESIQKSCNALIDVLQKQPDMNAYANLLCPDELTALYSSLRFGNDLHALECAYNIVLMLQQRGDVMSVMDAHASESRDFSACFHLIEQTWNKVSHGADALARELDAEREELEEPLRKEADFIAQINRDLQENHRLHSSLHAYFEERQIQERALLTTVSPRPVSTLQNERTLLPFGDAGISTTLMQQMYRPAIRQKIEHDLGMPLAEIPLRSQIHLLRFLADKNAETFDRLRTALQSHPDHAQSILLSFLSCSADPEMGNIILELAQYPELLVALDRYGDMANNAEALTANLASLTRGAGKSQFDSLHFYRQLIVQGNRTLRDAVRMIHHNPEKAEEVGQRCADMLRFSQDRVGLLHAMVRTLPRSEVSSMDLTKLPLVSINQGLVSDLGVTPAVRGMVRAAFPSEKDQQEFSAFTKREGAVLTLSLCEDHALGMFGSEPLADGRVRHIDWYCTNKAGPVRGLAEPTLRTAVNQIEPAQMLTCVASPEATSCETFIEHAGMVACGVTEPGEYEGDYLQLRRTASDAGLHGRALHSEHIDRLRALAQNGNGQIIHSEIQGTAYAACIVETDDLAPFFDKARLQFSNRKWVMSRLIRDPSSEQKHPRYLCIFEYDSASDEEAETIHRAFEEFRMRQRLAADDSQSSSNAIRNIETIE